MAYLDNHLEPHFFSPDAPEGEHSSILSST
jgi:hypothetical protein